VLLLALLVMVLKAVEVMLLDRVEGLELQGRLVELLEEELPVAVLLLLDEELVEEMIVVAFLTKISSSAMEPSRPRIKSNFIVVALKKVSLLNP